MQMGMRTTANLKIINQMAMGVINIKMVIFTLDNGQMEKNIIFGLGIIKMASYMKS